QPGDPRRSRGAQSVAPFKGFECRPRSGLAARASAAGIGGRPGARRGIRTRRPGVTPAGKKTHGVKRARRSTSADPKPARGTRRFVILTGLSGAGKTQAIRALEDLGYFCIDNLPSQLIPTMAELTNRDDASLSKVAIVVDVRESGFLKEFPRTYR